MAKEPRCKMCRREGRSLCGSAKCAVLKRKYPPGMHGHKGYPRLSEYGKQLREKQSLKRLYNLREKQFKNYFLKAKKVVGNTTVIFLRLLEQRLDNVVYKSGFAPTRRAARQMVGHGHIHVNGRRLNIPSYSVNVGDTISVKQKKSIIKAVEQRLSQKKDKDLLPSWLSLDTRKQEVTILKLPSREDLPQDFETDLIIAFYSR
ncbi:30S ribosomal protein S4 [Patescibacteria group bacterium AH-259-L05]|nr:30S ribosomal protein S4 [Patescibacteria group bacterium AH-259-L05]